MMYLFKSEFGNWAYYDKRTGMVVEVSEWKDKAANIEGDWVNMTKYFRIAVRFLSPVTFSLWDSNTRTNGLSTTSAAILTITKTAYEHFLKASEGRQEGSWYRLLYKKTKKMVYVDGVEWVDPINLPSIPNPTTPPPIASAQQVQPKPVMVTTNQPPSDLAPTRPNPAPITAPPISKPPIPNF